MKRPSLASSGIYGGLALAAVAGGLATKALGIGSAVPPTKTTTVTLTNGATGPTGPTGPAGPSGAESCPTGSDFQAVVLNTPGGHITLWTCVAT